MYLNWICKSKVKSYHEKDGQIFYSDERNDEISEKFVFKNKPELIDFHINRAKENK